MSTKTAYDKAQNCLHDTGTRGCNWGGDQSASLQMQMLKNNLEDWGNTGDGDSRDTNSDAENQCHIWEAIIKVGNTPFACWILMSIQS